MKSSRPAEGESRVPDQQQMFQDLRKAKERRARIAALLETRRERHIRIERVMQVQRRHRDRQAR